MNENDTSNNTAIVPIHNLSPEVFNNIARKPVSPEQAEVLLTATNHDDLDILPTGEVYLTQSKYRQRLNQAFDPGGWAMRPLSPPYVKDNLAMQEWALYANDGQFLAYAVGGATYQEDNRRMDWSDTLETVKSNALMRLCKDLGIALECWDKKFVSEFRAKYCVKVWRKNYDKPQWRRADAEPFYDETGPVQDSPKPKQPNSQPSPDQPTNGKPKLGRPMTPEQLLSAAKVKAAKDTRPSNDKQRKYAVSSLSKACGNDDHLRHSIGKYLFGDGKYTSETWTSGECSFIIDWIGATADNDYTPTQEAKQEIMVLVDIFTEAAEMNQSPQGEEEIPF